MELMGRCRDSLRITMRRNQSHRTGTHEEEVADAGKSGRCYLRGLDHSEICINLAGSDQSTLPVQERSYRALIRTIRSAMRVYLAFRSDDTVRGGERTKCSFELLQSANGKRYSLPGLLTVAARPSSCPRTRFIMK